MSAVVRHFLSVRIDDQQLTGCDELDSLSCLEDSALFKDQRLVFRTGFADRDKRGGLSQAINLSYMPTKITFHTLNRGCRRGGSCRHDPQPAADATANLLRCVGERDEHGRRRAHRRNLLAFDQFESQPWIDLAQADVQATNGGDGPGEGPSIGVEHRQRPQVAVAARHGKVHESPYDIHVGVAMGDHYAFRA